MQIHFNIAGIQMIMMGINGEYLWHNIYESYAPIRYR
jgi:hypothetical protein